MSVVIPIFILLPITLARSQGGAGEGSMFSDALYTAAGAEIVSAEEAWKQQVQYCIPAHRMQLGREKEKEKREASTRVQYEAFTQ
jgi:NAD/NADP transhydrogenase alpha subunit